MSSKENALEDQDLSFLNPNRPQTDQHQQVLCSDNKLCPKSVRPCKLFKKPFVVISEKFVIKTFVMWEVTEASGAINKYTGKIYRHDIRKGLYDWNAEFCFGTVIVHERKKEKKLQHGRRLNVSDTISTLLTVKHM